MKNCILFREDSNAAVRNVYFCISIIVLLISLSLIPVYAAGEVSVGINGQDVNYTTDSGKPFIDSANRIQVPFRLTLESFGAVVKWDSTNKTAYATMGEVTVTVPVNERYFYRNGDIVVMDTAARIQDGRVYLPIRPVLEAFGATVSWDSSNSAVHIARKNIYTSRYLEELVETTEPDQEVTDFRNGSNSRRNGLLKASFKYLDIYYPDTDAAKACLALLEPHVDKVYMMLTDLYGQQAKAEVHLIDEYKAQNLREGDIRARENVTLIWLEQNNDSYGNNLAEFVHEVNHCFENEVNGDGTNTMWVSEASSKLMASIYTEYNYMGIVDQWEFSDLNSIASKLRSWKQEFGTMTFEKADRYLRVARAWDRASGEREFAQRYGLYFWMKVYDESTFDQFKYYLRNKGNGSVIPTFEKLLGKDSNEITEWINSDLY